MTVARSLRPPRIAMIAPPWFMVPPEGYGGVENMCADLVDGLVDRGHQVTLIGAGKPGRAQAASRRRQWVNTAGWKAADKLHQLDEVILWSRRESLAEYEINETLEDGCACKCR